jgi:flagellar protein FlgJ
MTPLLPATMQAATSSAGATVQDAAQHRKLVDAAHQFEAMFLQEMLKPMNSLGRSDGADEDAGDQGEDGTLQSMGTESMARAIAQAGGFGVARHIVAEVEREHDQREATEKNQTTLKSSAGSPIQSVRRSK